MFNGTLSSTSHDQQEKVISLTAGLVVEPGMGSRGLFMVIISSILGSARWSPLDLGGKDFALAQFGVSILAAMSDPRKSTAAKRHRHWLITQWRGVADGPLMDLPVKSVGDVVGKVMKAAGLGDRLMLDDVLAAWQQVAGEFIAKNTLPDGFTRGVLQVRCTQPSVHHALMQEKPALLKKLNEKLGAGKIKDVRIRHG